MKKTIVYEPVVDATAMGKAFKSKAEAKKAAKEFYATKEFDYLRGSVRTISFDEVYWVSELELV